VNIDLERDLLWRFFDLPQLSDGEPQRRQVLFVLQRAPVAPAAAADAEVKVMRGKIQAATPPAAARQEAVSPNASTPPKPAKQ
jgi:hypothetical protein